MSLLKLLDRFAEQREFFDDDPQTALKQRKLEWEDFTADPDKPWDAYPLVGFLLKIWEITEDFVPEVVHDLYPTDTDVASDTGLKSWMDAKPATDCKVQRIATDGHSRRSHRCDHEPTLPSHRARRCEFEPDGQPGILLRRELPTMPPECRRPGAERSNHHPAAARTPAAHGTLGRMTTFFYTSVYTPANVSLIPSGGISLDLYFPASQKRCNDALLWYKHRIRAFIDSYVAAWDKELTQLRGHGSTTPSDAVAYTNSGRGALRSETLRRIDSTASCEPIADLGSLALRRPPHPST